MVCNAQHPSRLRALDKVTQLYVSVDASTKESLKKIDRPLFKDFWERFLECLDILSQKGQRTGIEFNASYLEYASLLMKITCHPLF